MRRRIVVFVVAVVFLLAGYAVGRASDGISISGLISASDAEMAEGYFAIGQEVTIVAKPGGTLYSWLVSHKDEKVLFWGEVVRNPSSQ